MDQFDNAHFGFYGKLPTMTGKTVFDRDMTC